MKVPSCTLFRFCLSKIVDQTIKGKKGKKKGLKVIFTSDKKKSGGGAQCTATCIDPPAPTTTTATTTKITTTTTPAEKVLCGQTLGSFRRGSKMMDPEEQGFF